MLVLAKLLTMTIALFSNLFSKYFANCIKAKCFLLADPLDNSQSRTQDDMKLAEEIRNGVYNYIIFAVLCTVLNLEYLSMMI